MRVALSLSVLLILSACDSGMVWETDDDLTLVDGGMGGMDAGPGRDAGMDSGPAMDSGAPPFDGGPPMPDCESAIEAEERAITNAERTGAGLGPLECDPGMGRAARLHAQDMCANNYFSHTSQDGRRFSDRMTAEGVTFRAGGENIARGQQTPQSVHNAWMNSPGHRRNILNDAYGRIGVGYVECGGRPLWVQVFAD